MKAFTLSTPIYYINDNPHLGTAYTSILTDTLARFHRARGEDVFFITGTDENGEKIIRAAEGRGITPRELVDTMSERYRSAWSLLNISHNHFIRTTDPAHICACQEMFRALQANGDIYKGRYEGWYCVPCETFVVDAPDGTCPECSRTLERVQRDSYFFALSRFTDRLLQHFKDNPEFVVPEFRKNEVTRFIEAGLRDMSITRTNNGWGIPVPGDPEHVLYVWFDALINYIAASGYPDSPEKLEHFWPASLHVIGKDILVRFHATLWPAMLMSAGQPVPRQILAHGWLMLDGEKMSKSRIARQIASWQDRDAASLRVTSLQPEDLIRSIQDEAGIASDRQPIAVDALRFFLMRDLPVGGDAEFSLERLVERYNADLANDLGNLLNRTLSMLQRYCDGVVPMVASGPMAEACATAVQGAVEAYESLQPSEALARAWDIINAGNHHIDDKKPWVLQREGRVDEIGPVLYACGEACRIVAVLLAPVMPAAALEILRQLGIEPGPAELQWDRTHWGGWLPGAQALTPEPIFPRIDTRKRSAEPGPLGKKGAAHPADSLPPVPAPTTQTTPCETEAVAAASSDEIGIEDFMRVKLRIATITAAERVPKARKLLLLTLDLGDDQRQIVSGIAERYEPEALIGRQIAVIVNLKPATIRGVTSYGMLLAADMGGDAVLLQPDSHVAPGSPIR